MANPWIRVPVAERFWPKVERRGPDECWPWRAGIFKSGYGQVHLEDQSPGYAHRVSYELAHGPIPDGLVIDHTCHTEACPGGPSCPHRRCVNPAHLVATTDRRNSERGMSPHAVNARKTACPKGHPYTEANTYRDPKGYRHCRTCMRASDRARGK